MGGFAGFTKGISSVVEPRLQAGIDAKRKEEDDLRSFYMKAAAQPGISEAQLKHIEEQLNKLSPTKEGKGIVQKFVGMLGQVHKHAKQGQGQPQASPAGAVPPMQQNGKQSGSDAMGAETGGVPQTPPQAAVPLQSQGQQPSPNGAVPPRPQANAAFAPVPARKPGMYDGFVDTAQAVSKAQGSEKQQTAQSDQDRKDKSAVDVYGKELELGRTSAKKERGEIQQEREAEADKLELKGDQRVEFIANGKIAQPKPQAMKEAWVKKPGEDTLTKVWVRPGSNERMYADSGEVVPEEVPTVNPGQITAKERENYYGSYGNYYRAAKGQGYSDEAAKAKAGEMVQREFGVKLSSQEASIALKQQTREMNFELSGVGGGGGTSSGGASKAPAATGAPAKPGTRPSPKGAVRKPGEPPLIDKKDDEYINMYLNSLFQNAQSGRGGSASAVGVNKGMNLLAKASGLSPVEFQTAQAIKKDGIKAIADTYKRYNAVSRVGDLLEGFGQNVEELGKKAIATGSPLLNRAWKTISLDTVGNPDLRQYMLALNAMQRQYGVLTAGGALSNAMLPVSVGAKVEELMSPNQTLAEAIASVAQVKKETEIEKKGYLKSIKGTAEDVRRGVFSEDKPSDKNPESRFTTHFVEGQDAWDIPAAKVEAFKKSHPKAQAQ